MNNKSDKKSKIMIYIDRYFYILIIFEFLFAIILQIFIENSFNYAINIEYIVRTILAPYIVYLNFWLLSKFVSKKVLYFINWVSIIFFIFATLYFSVFTILNYNNIESYYTVIMGTLITYAILRFKINNNIFFNNLKKLETMEEYKFNSKKWL